MLMILATEQQQQWGAQICTPPEPKQDNNKRADEIDAIEAVIVR